MRHEIHTNKLFARQILQAKGNGNQMLSFWQRNKKNPETIFGEE